MKIAAVIVTSMLAVVAQGADWRQELSPEAPGKFPLSRPFHATYRFGWSALSAADSTFDFTKTKTGEAQLDMSVNTTGAVRKLFRLDAQHTAVATAATLRPVSVRQTEIYKDETLKTNLDFDPDGVRRTRTSDHPTPGNGNEKRLKFSPLFDLHTALLFIRSQRLPTGETYRLVVYPSVDPYFAEITVLGRGKVKAGGAWYDSIKLGIKLRRVSKKLELQKHDRFKRATAWLTDDPDRMLLKVEAEIFVGNVWVELRKVDFLPEATEPKH